VVSACRIERVNPQGRITSLPPMTPGLVVSLGDLGCERCAIPTRDPATQERWPQLLRWLAAERDTMFGILARALSPAVVRRGERVSGV
jgi:MOSC domain